MLITLFSATNYCGTANNAGAILVLGRDLVVYPKLIHPLPPQAALDDSPVLGDRGASCARARIAASARGLHCAHAACCLAQTRRARRPESGPQQRTPGCSPSIAIGHPRHRAAASGPAARRAG